MASRIEINVDKTYDRGPMHGFLEVEVSFEEKAPPGSDQGIGFAQVIVPLPKAEEGGKTFDQIRVMALAKALSFMSECIKSASAT